MIAKRWRWRGRRRNREEKKEKNNNISLFDSRSSALEPTNIWSSVLAKKRNSGWMGHKEEMKKEGRNKKTKEMRRVKNHHDHHHHPWLIPKKSGLNSCNNFFSLYVEWGRRRQIRSLVLENSHDNHLFPPLPSSSSFSSSSLSSTYMIDSKEVRFVFAQQFLLIVCKARKTQTNSIFHTLRIIMIVWPYGIGKDTNTAFEKMMSDNDIIGRGSEWLFPTWSSWTPSWTETKRTRTTNKHTDRQQERQDTKPTPPSRR